MWEKTSYFEVPCTGACRGEATWSLECASDEQGHKTKRARGSTQGKFSGTLATGCAGVSCSHLKFFVLPFIFKNLPHKECDPHCRHKF